MSSSERAHRGDSPSVHTHLEIAQSVIRRMASNSASCKTWCITLVSAVLIIVADKDKSVYALIAFIPIILFLALDTYYLALEKRFRNAYNDFIDKAHKDKLAATDFYAITPNGCPWKALAQSLVSFSIWPFYMMLGLMVWLCMKIVIST